METVGEILTREKEKWAAVGTAEEETEAGATVEAETARDGEGRMAEEETEDGATVGTAGVG